MKILIIAFLAIAVAIVVSMALLVLVTVVVVTLALVAAAWVASYFILGRKPALTLGRDAQVRRLTDRYVAGHFDLGEFERRVAHVLARR
jgi:hypothetical protein